MRSTNRFAIPLSQLQKTPREKVQNIPNNSRNIKLDIEDVARMRLLEFTHKFTYSDHRISNGN